MVARHATRRHSCRSRIAVSLFARLLMTDAANLRCSGLCQTLLIIGRYGTLLAKFPSPLPLSLSSLSTFRPLPPSLTAAQFIGVTATLALMACFLKLFTPTARFSSTRSCSRPRSRSPHIITRFHPSRSIASVSIRSPLFARCSQDGWDGSVAYLSLQDACPRPRERFASAVSKLTNAITDDKCVMASKTGGLGRSHIQLPLGRADVAAARHWFYAIMCEGGTVVSLLNEMFPNGAYIYDTAQVVSGYRHVRCGRRGR